MTEDERDDLIDLYIEDALPEPLRARMEDYLSRHPDEAAAVAALRATAARLQAAPADRPDDWFVERTLDRLLREHGAAHFPQDETRIHSR